MGLTLERTVNPSNQTERARLLWPSLGQPLTRGLKRLNWPIIGTMLIILTVGVFLRIYPSAGVSGLGVDERGYMVFLKQIQRAGLINYDVVVKVFVEKQYHRLDAVVPATRIGFLVPAYLCGKLFHLSEFDALRTISLAASIALLLATAAMAYRFGNPTQMLGVTALVAVAPLQIYLAQRALIDGYFALLAILCAWFFFEAIRAPKRNGWLAAYGLSLFLLVLTKENAAFVFAALLATAAVLFFVRVSRPGLPLLAVTFLAPALGLGVLAFFMGGIHELITFYRMFVQKSTVNLYVLRFQDGAWYRYLIDFTVLSPAIVILVYGRIFQLEKKPIIDLFWALFLGFSLMLMSSLRYGMSLRFAAYWDEPLRWLAASQVLAMANRIPTRLRAGALIAAFIVLAGIDLAQYHRLFVRARIYDPVSAELLHASDLIK